jgi:transposase-like protein
MDDKLTISTFQLFQMFPDQEAARVYLEARRWPQGLVCPVCTKGDRITVREGGFYRCNACKEDFTVRTGTIFERSHVPLHKWLYAMYLLVTARKGISSLQLSKEIGITQKSAWFVLGRLREACGADLKVLRGIVALRLRVRRCTPRPLPRASAGCSSSALRSTIGSTRAT